MHTPESVTPNIQSPVAPPGATPPAEPSTSPLHSEPVPLRLNDCVSSPLRWLWPGRVPVGKLTLMIGDPGLGKSLVSLNFAAHVSRGTPPPRLEDEAVPAEPASPGSVVLLSTEDGVSDTIVPRLAAADADLRRIALLQLTAPTDVGDSMIQHRGFSLETDLAALEHAIRSLEDCRLVIIDPISAHLGERDDNNQAVVRRLLAPLADLAARTNVAVLAINHLNKQCQGRAIYRALGSLAFAAIARSVLAVLADPHRSGGRAVVSLKSNAAEAVDGIGFQIKSTLGDIQRANGDNSNQGGQRTSPMPVIDWDTTPIRMTAEEILHTARHAGPAIDEAAAWLESVLADGHQAAADLKSRARQDGIHERTLLRAKARLRVVTSRDGFGLGGSWRWSLPKA